MLQQNLEALEQTLDQNNVESFHTPLAPLKPVQETPSLSDWLRCWARKRAGLESLAREI